MLRASSMNVDSKGNAALYSIREAKAAFPIPPVSCFEHHFQWLCQFGGWCQPGLADFKASLYHCEYFMSVFYMQDQNDESCLFLLWSRKDCLGSRLRDKFTIFFFFFYVVFSLTLSLGALEFTPVIHCRYLTLLHWPLRRTAWVCAQSLSHVWLCDPMCSSVHGILQAKVME